MLTECELLLDFKALAHKKAHASMGHLVSNGVMAGAMIALAGYAYLVIKSFGGSQYLAALGFCSGQVMVVALQAELFTSNVVLVFQTGGGRLSWGRVLRNWGVVYLANFIGSLLLVWLLVHAGAGEALEHAAGDVFAEKTDRLLGEYLARGFLCNFLVVMAYQMTLFMRDFSRKVLAIIFPIALFVLCGFENCVANMFLIPFGAALDGVGFAEGTQLLFRNLVPVTVANILGGIAVLAVQPCFQQMIRNKERVAI
jgi:formate/nitrite transporter FocA (FNT family)